jgi:hypothetical protein
MAAKEGPDINDTFRTEGAEAARRRHDKAKRYNSGGGSNGTHANLIQSSAQFVTGFVPPEYVLVGVVQRRFIYSLTARTGSGKTAILLLLAACIAIARAIGSHVVKRGRVLYFAGENPDDVRMRWIAMADEMGFDLNAIDVYFIPGSFKISEMRAQSIKEMQAIGENSLSSLLIRARLISRAMTRAIINRWASTPPDSEPLLRIYWASPASS